MFSSSSHAKWEKVGSSGGGSKTFYVDFERIRKHDGYVYYWNMTDRLKPLKSGVLSSKTYNQGDCKSFRFKSLSFSSHKAPMGDRIGETYTPQDKWLLPSPNSVDESILKIVCSR